MPILIPGGGGGGGSGPTIPVIAPIALDTFHRRILPFAPDASTFIVDDFVRQAAKDFTEATRIWRYVWPEIVVGSPESSFTMALPAGSSLFELEYVSLDGRNYRPSAEHVVRGAMARRDNFNSTPVVFQSSPDTLFVVPEVGANVKLGVLGALSVTLDTPELPGVLRNYVDTLVDGALWLLLGVPGRTYTNFEMSHDREKRYLNARSLASIQVSRGHSSATVRRQPRFF